MQTPEGMPSISPVLFYADLNVAVNWLCSAFNFAERKEERVVDDQNVVQHAELTLGNGLVILSLEYEEFKIPTPESVHHQLLYVFVDSVDEHAANARGKGATITHEPANRDYGARVYGVQDFAGYHWIFAQQL